MLKGIPGGDGLSDRIMHIFPLATRVLVVAVARPHDGPDCWTAYCDAVEGQSHKVEAVAVAEYGNKLGETVARAIFTWLTGPYID